MTLAIHAERPPPDRGALLTPEEVAALIGGDVSTAWCRAHVPQKIRLGHRTVRWYEHDVRNWLAQRAA